MSILTRYIVVTWLRLLALCMGSFIAVYLVLDMMEKIPRFIRAGGAFIDIMRFFLYKLPEMIGSTAAFSILMATLLTLGLFSKNSELIAMRSCGISLPKIALPMLILGFLASILLLLNAELIVPVSYGRMATVERVDIKKEGANAVFRRGNIWFRSGTDILQADMLDPDAKALKGVVIWMLDDAMNPIRRIDSKQAEFRGDRWSLIEPMIKDFQNGIGYSLSKLPKLDVVMNLKLDDLRLLDNNADNMSFRQLKEYADNLEKGGYKAFRYLTMMQTKLSGAFSAFIMVMLGIPFALRSSRSGGIALGIGASVAIGFAYFVVNAVLLSYGRNGVLPPVVAAWGANMIFCLAAIWMAMTVKN